LQLWRKIDASSLAHAYPHFFRRFPPVVEFVFLGSVTGLVLFPIWGVQSLLLFTIPRFIYLLDTPVHWGQFLLRLWGFGFGFFCVSLYWICQALFVEFEVFWWLIPFCFLGIPAFMSAFMALLSLWFLGWAYTVHSKVLRLLFLQFGYMHSRAVSRLLMVAAWWVSAEYFLTDFCTGLPWSLVGYTWSSILVVAQLASIGSVYSLTFLTVCIAGLPYLYFSLTPSRFTTFYVKIAAGMIVFILGFGGVRLYLNDPSYTSTKMRLVQPFLTESPVWKLEEQRLNLDKLLRLSQVGTVDHPDIIIWPESALGFYLEGDLIRKKLGEAIPSESYLMFGAARRDQGQKKLWNSLYVLNHRGETVATYDKHHLVPFGEYVPLRAWLEKLLPQAKIRKITSGLLDFSKGSGSETIQLPMLPSFSPNICYEAIFPGQVTAPHPSPQWLLQVTNDVWFGNSMGPYQHFQIARMRAIEEGVPLVRVANSGISGVVDPYGRILQQMNLGEVGTMDVLLPKALSSPPLCRIFFSLMAWIDPLDPLSSR
jgi:apolipoprotein N-acyltransferase